MEHTTLPLYRLGVDGPQLTPIGLGTARFSGGSGAFGRYWGDLPEQAVTEIVGGATAAGINWFETAEAYGGGNAERALAGGLSAAGAGAGASFLALSKTTPLLFSGKLERLHHQRQEALKPYDIGMYLLSVPHGPVSMDAVLRAAAKLKAQGRVAGIGVGNFSAEQLARAVTGLADEGVSLWANRVRFHLLDRRIESNDVLSACKQFGVTVVACSPLAHGVLSGEYHQNPQLIRQRPGLRRFSRQFQAAALRRSRPLLDVLEHVAGERGVGTAEVVLNWTTRFFGEHMLALVGVRSVPQLNAAVESLRFRLSERELAHINQASWEVCGRCT